MPKNAELDYTGSDWKCSRGYRKSESTCIAVSVPKNASLDFTGANWKCDPGYKRAGAGCQQMTPNEARAQQDQMKRILEELAKRRAAGVNGDDCESEYKTNAEVCVSVDSTELNCSESYLGNYYQSCDASLSYSVSTDYSGGSYLEAEVECNLEIKYRGKDSYAWSHDSAAHDEDHDLYAHDTESGHASFMFLFSPYLEVVAAEVVHVECEIDDVELW